jgi:5-methylcytosine-specific restriction endonuclease McrA
MKKKITKAQLERKEKKRLKREYKDGMKEWVRLVKERDNYTCQLCGKKLDADKPAGLAAHHIIPRTIRELSLDVMNGITLCSYCHHWSPFAVHQNCLYASLWLQTNRKEQYDYLVAKLLDIAKNKNMEIIKTVKIDAL